MGYILRRWLADRLPATLSSGERLVALEIADKADDETRRAYGRDLLDVVRRRTGLASVKQVGNVLGKLGASGIELRVPVLGKDEQPVKDKAGRTVFACRGHQLEFYIPTLEKCPALVPFEEKAPAVAGPLNGPAPTGPLPNGPAPAAEWSRADGQMVPPARPYGPVSAGPSPLSSLSSPSSLSPQVPQESAEAPPAAPAERETSAAPNDNGDVAKVAEAWTAARGQSRNPAAEQKIRDSAVLLLSVGWSIPDLITLAEDMAHCNPSYTDLGKHEPHWQRPAAPRPPVAALQDCRGCEKPARHLTDDDLCQGCAELDPATVVRALAEQLAGTTPAADTKLGWRDRVRAVRPEGQES